MVIIKLSKEIENKHENYFKDKILPKLIDSKLKKHNYKVKKEEAHRIHMDVNILHKVFRTQHNGFIDFIENNYIDFAIGKPKTLKDLHEQIKKSFPIIYEMLKESSSSEKEDSYNNYLYNLFGYEKFKVKDLYYYVKKMAEEATGKDRYCKEVREKIVEILKSNYPKLKHEINNRLMINQRKLSADEFAEEFKKLTDINITMDNFNEIDIFGTEWSDYAFVMESGLRVCPYCNRQYITPVFSDSGKMRADLDHFLPKSRYPYFSMSLYNLIPVCKSCNQSLKGSKESGFNDINPYEDNLDDYFTFKADVFTSEISIEKVKGKTKDISLHTDKFKIEPLYNYHRNQVDELIRKRIAYPDKYIKKLFDDNRDYFKDENEIKQLLIGYIHDKSKLNDEAFLKLRRDIAEQLGFINGKQDDMLIEQLKKIITKI
ncbi:HNH endonuclease domain-containing protein [Clostridium beijerinckii]|uniref:HNH endonuclease domain-containing protein n=1 Tax=Clostridium beijerinckii TaxID=1520 RepID=UPI001570035A|nr:HNH endonuclease domain-containing protein [Clostridium beijerinckii]NRT72415.1 transcription elongation factor Elf1 [Clostridium beijerinckii]